MKCQKCNRPSVVHLTEIVTESDGSKHPMEIHLCVVHAVQAGLVAAEAPVPDPSATNMPPTEVEGVEMGIPTSIVPVKPSPKGLAVVRHEPSDSCPICGTNWNQFRQHGLMGCPHDYAMFESKLVPLLKRAQENATQHAGKVPTKLRQGEPVREVVTLRLRRELQKALDAENYEQAAQLRDQLKKLGSN